MSVTQGSRTASLADAFTYYTAATRLAFVTQPTDSDVGTDLDAFTVRLEDSTGAPVTLQGGTVTLAATHPAGVPASGTLSAPVIDGEASFANVSFAHGGGKGITLTATATGVTSATSASFDVTATLPSGSGRVFATTGARLWVFDAEDLQRNSARPRHHGPRGWRDHRRHRLPASHGAALRPWKHGAALHDQHEHRCRDASRQSARVHGRARDGLRSGDRPSARQHDHPRELSRRPGHGRARGGRHPSRLCRGRSTPDNPHDIRKNAHSRNFAGGTATTLYGIDPTLDVLVRQDPPNAGALSTVGNLGVDATIVRGFDIVGNDDAIAVMTTAGGVTRVHRINLTLGTATAVAGQDMAAAVLDIAIEPSTIVLATGTNVLLTMSSARPAAIVSAIPITGLQANETIVGMDFSPLRNELFAVGSTSRLYRVDPSTAVATGIGGVFGTTLDGAAFGVDVDPSTGNVRVTSGTGQNLLIDGETGSVTVGTALGGGGFVGLAATPSTPGATPTFLGVDSTTDRLMRVNLATGARTDIGALGTDVDATSSLDATPLGTIYGTTLRGELDLRPRDDRPATGALSSIRDLPTSLSIAAMAVPALASPRPLMVIHDATSNELQLMDIAGVRSSTSTITGLTAGDSIRGIDFRPSTGTLCALGFNFNSFGIEGALHTVDTGTGAISGGRFSMPRAIGSTLNAATRFGFDFDPVADLLRVVSTGRDNFRLNPMTAAATTDTLLTPAGTTGVGAAYTGNVGATSTTLYAIDATSSQLVILGGNPVPSGASPNGGVATVVGSLGFTVSTDAGFDIASSGAGYAVLLAGGQWGVYRIDLATGAANLKFSLAGTNTRRGLALLR